jgi:hypothetical protein
MKYKQSWASRKRFANLGPKQLYVYKDLKITFVKVSDPQ